MFPAARRSALPRRAPSIDRRDDDAATQRKTLRWAVINGVAALGGVAVSLGGLAYGVLHR